MKTVSEFASNQGFHPMHYFRKFFASTVLFSFRYLYHRNYFWTEIRVGALRWALAHEFLELMFT